MASVQPPASVPGPAKQLLAGVLQAVAALEQEVQGAVGLLAHLRQRPIVLSGVR